MQVLVITISRIQTHLHHCPHWSRQDPLLDHSITSAGLPTSTFVSTPSFLTWAASEIPGSLVQVTRLLKAWYQLMPSQGPAHPLSPPPVAPSCCFSFSHIGLHRPCLSGFWCLMFPLPRGLFPHICMAHRFLLHEAFPYHPTEITTPHPQHFLLFFPDLLSSVALITLLLFC